MKRPHRLLAATLIAGAFGGAGAAEAPAPVDAEFLEFLGSLDTEDEEWREYLAERPLGEEKPARVDKPASRPDGKAAPARKAGQQEEVKKP